MLVRKRLLFLLVLAVASLPVCNARSRNSQPSAGPLDLQTTVWAPQWPCLLSKQTGHYVLKTGQLVLNDVPHHFQIDLEVGMDQDISEASDPGPVDSQT